MIKNEAVVNENESIAAANELKEEVERLRGLLSASTSNERVAELEQDKQGLQDINGSLSKMLEEARAVDAEKEHRLKSQERQLNEAVADLKDAQSRLVRLMYLGIGVAPTYDSIRLPLETLSKTFKWPIPAIGNH